MCLPVHFNLIKMHKLNLLLCVCCLGDFIVHNLPLSVCLVILLFIVHNLPLCVCCLGDFIVHCS